MTQGRAYHLNLTSILWQKKQTVISLCMLVCFIIAYLPVTGSWFLAMNGRADLSALVISAVKIKKQAIDTHDISQSLDTLFQQLKIATGQIKIKRTPDKEKIHLIEIMPEYPVRPRPFRLKFIQKPMGALPGPCLNYTSICILIDPPPPRIKSGLHCTAKAYKFYSIS